MKTNTIFTIVATILSVSIMAIMGYVIKTQHNIINSIEQSNKQQVFLKDNITRIQSSLLTSKEFDKRLNSLDVDLDVIKRDLFGVGGKINSILTAKSKTPGGVYTGLPSSNVTPIDGQPIDPDSPNCVKDTFGYLSSVQSLDLEEPLSEDISVPWGNVEFNGTEKNPWSYEVKPRTYSSTVVVATDAEGDKRAYTKMSITVDDKKYDMPEVQTTYSERYPSPKFFLWNPTLMGGVDVGYSSNPDYTVMPSAQVFVASHGKTKKDSKWHIGGVGMGYDVMTDNYTVMVTPFAYKPTSNTSVIKNTYVGPSVGADVKGRVYGTVGVKVGF